MDSSLKLFLIGIAVGISALIFSSMGDTEELWKNPGSYFSKFLYVGATTWFLIFMAMMVTSLPFIAIESLKRRLTPKQYLPFPFMAGNSFAVLSVQIIATILEAIH